MPRFRIERFDIAAETFARAGIDQRDNQTWLCLVPLGEGADGKAFWTRLSDVDCFYES